MFEFGAKLTLHDGMAGVMKKNIELQRQFREQLSSSGIEIGKLNSKGMRFPVGQHVIVCKDAVVILSVTEEGLGVNLVNNRLDMDYELGISNEAVEAFMALEEVQELGE